MNDYAKPYDWPADPYPAPPTANDLWLNDMRREIIRQRYEAALERKRAREAARPSVLLVTADMISRKVTDPKKPKRKQKTPGIVLPQCSHIKVLVVKPVSLWAESMRAA